MRILVISQYFWPENFRINDLVHGFVARGHEVTILTGYPNYPTGQIFSEFKEKNEGFSKYYGSEIIRVPLIPRGKNGWCLILNYLSFMLSASLWGAYKLKDKNFDIIFVFEPSPITVGIPAIVLSKLKKAPIVFWVLDLWPDTLEALGIIRSKKILSMVGWLATFIYARCNLVLGPSKSALESIGKYSSKEKIRFFPNWVEKLFEEPSVEFAPEITSDAAYFNIIFAGNIGEAQDFPAILVAAEALKNHSAIRWFIIGEGHLSSWLQKEVKRLALNNCFFLLGQFSIDRMPSFFAHADGLLVTLKAGSAFSLTIPGKVQSYMMANVPLLGMLDGEGARVIQEAEAGLVCNAGDSYELVSNILELHKMPKQDRLKLGQNAKSYAEREFARDKLMNRLEDWLLEIAERGVI